MGPAPGRSTSQDDAVLKKAGLQKTTLITLVVVLSNVIGNLFLSFGMKSESGMVSPWVFGGVALLILWALSRMTLLSWADLSFVLPVTAIGYPLSAIAAQVFLSETITPHRWAGTALIVAGTVLVGLTTPPHTKGGVK